MTQWLLPTLAVVLLGGCAQFNVAMDNKGEAAISANAPTLFNWGEKFVKRVSEAANKTCSIYWEAHGNSVRRHYCSSFSKGGSFIKELKKNTGNLCGDRTEDQINKIMDAVYNYCSEPTADKEQKLTKLVHTTCNRPSDKGDISYDKAQSVMPGKASPNRSDNGGNREKHADLERLERGIVMAKQLLGLADIIPKHSVEVKFSCDPVRPRSEREADPSL